MGTFSAAGSRVVQLRHNLSYNFLESDTLGFLSTISMLSG